jgi:hypothetical protein
LGKYLKNLSVRQSWSEVDNLEAEYLYFNLHLKDSFLTEAAEKPSPTIKSLFYKHRV